ncbi:MAG TPA: hypothetical protein VFI17_05575 [Solirubrobacterales bacterium]|nr:hypothetical protein [Solirubrobacterales bacterium]
MHMLLIPGLIAALIFVHLWLVVKLGVTPSFTTSHMCTKMSAPMAPGISSMCSA